MAYDRPNTLLTAQPWPHLVLDDFLPPHVLADALEEIRAETYDYEIEPRGTGRIEFSILKSETLWRSIYSKKTSTLLSVAFDARVKLNRQNLLQLRRMNDDTPAFPLHNDFASNEDTIASFLYLTPGWSPEFGGQLHLYETGEQTTPSRSLAPLQNRLVSFRTKPMHWHAVERVCNWERLSVLALWDIEAEEHSAKPQ